MRELFSGDGWRALHDFVRPDLLCLFDFDGTLVALEPRPEQVNVPAKVFERLHALQQRARVGIVTGRSLKDMHRMLNSAFEPDYLIGNHGIEGLPGWGKHASAFEAVCERWQVQLQSAIASIDKRIWIEYKRYSLSIHYLQAQHPQAVALQLSRLFERLSPPPKIVAGKAVFNLLPEGASDKGRAVTELMKLTGASCALYAGDDVTDEYVFALARDDIFSVRVGDCSNSDADFLIPDHEAIVPLIDGLINCLTDPRVKERQHNG